MRDLRRSIVGVSIDKWACAGREILQLAQGQDAGFPSFVRAGRMTILFGSSASLLTLFGERSNYRNAVGAKRVAAWRRIAQLIELGEIIGGAA